MRPAPILIAILVLLNGCAAGFGTTTFDRDKDVEFSVLDSVRTGMTEPDVVSVMGKPSKHGVDDHGRYHLEYNFMSIKTRSFVGAFSFIGFASAASTISVPQGFTADIWIDGGTVRDVAYTRYEPD